MKHFTILFLVIIGFTAQCQAGSAIIAQTIEQEYRDVMKRWKQQLEIAPTPEQRFAVLQLRPDVLPYCDRIKAQVRGESQHAWTLQYQSFLLENDTRITEDDELALIEWVNRNHLKSPGVGRFCVALVVNRPSQGAAHHQKVLLAEKVALSHPDKSEQGLGALAQSMILASLGENKKVLAKRLNLVKKAIIHSADIDLGGVPAVKYAEAEVFKITKLSIGQVAPEIEGVDVSKVPFRLSDYRGKITMLVFWNSRDKGAQELMDFCRKVVAKRIGEPFALIGVNSDSAQDLGSMKIDGSVTWRNFSDPSASIFLDYYVATSPWCMVLNEEGKIAYKGAAGEFANLVVDGL